MLEVFSNKGGLYLIGISTSKKNVEVKLLLRQTITISVASKTLLVCISQT